MEVYLCVKRDLIIPAFPSTEARLGQLHEIVSRVNSTWHWEFEAIERPTKQSW